MLNKEKIYTTTLTGLEELNPSVKLFCFQFDQPFSFAAGQFVMIHLAEENGKPIKRAYSIASSPKHKNSIQLCIRKVAGGSATSFLFGLKVGETVKIAGPLGKFQLNEKVPRDVVFVGGGTGIAPIRSMLHTLPIKEMKQKFCFYFGINTLADYLFEEELKQWTALKNFNLVLVVNNDPKWKGDAGFISEAVMKKHTPNLSDKDIYMCGPPSMIRFIKAYLPNLSAKPEQIHIDAWE